MGLYLINSVYSYGILLTIGIAFLTLLTLAFFRKDKNAWLTYVQTHYTKLILVLISLGVLASLYYSEVASFTPCKLCWIQRIFIFPQILFILLNWKSVEKYVFKFLLWMNGIAFTVALLHNYIYYFGKELAGTCDAAASCKAYYVYEMGFITIPFMALGLLFSTLTILLVKKLYKGNETTNQ